MRHLLIFLSKIRWMQQTISRLPGVRQMARRFIAGDSLPDAISAIQKLNSYGINGSLDLLGENTTNLADADKATKEILQIFDEINASGIGSNVSIKLSQFGLGIDQYACMNKLGEIFSRAGETDNFVRIDMEDSSMTGKTLEIYKWALKNGYSRTGIVIQAYLHRSRTDIEELASIHPRIRLCKGAYHEPANLAFPKKQDVDNNYDILARRLLEITLENGAPPLSENGRIPPIPAFATHDQARIKSVIELAKSLHFPLKSLEFQMLYGIRRDLQFELTQSGYPVRVYVPYGPQWYPYFMRRLAERPANVLFFISQLFRK